MIGKVVILGLLIVPIFAWEASNPEIPCKEPEKRFEKISAEGDRQKIILACKNIIDTCSSTNEKEKEFIKFLEVEQAKLEKEIADEEEMERNGGYPVLEYE